MTVYLTPYLVAQLTGLAVALWRLRGTIKPPYWKAHRWFLAVVVAVEITAIALHNHPAGNHLLYNVFLPVEAAFVGNFLYRLLLPVSSRRFQQGCFIALLLVAAIYVGEMLTGGVYAIARHSITWLSFVLGGMSLFYLVLLAQVGVSERSVRQASFWWATGTAMFYTGTLLAGAGLPLLWESSVSWGGFSPYQLIFNGLNVVLYGAWVGAFLCIART